MTSIASIGAGIHTSVAFKAGTAVPTAVDNTGFETITNVREIPSFGTPANIVNVPVYGQATSSQIQGQADAPLLELTLNYVPAEASHEDLESLAGTSTQQLVRIRLANGTIPDTPTAADQFDDFYFVATVASFLVTPNLTDSNQATVTFAIQGDFAGPFTLVTP